MTHKEMFKSSTYDSLEKQVGGNHYAKMKIQPAEFMYILSVISEL